MDRQRLIDRKHEVQAQIRQVRGRLQNAQAAAVSRRDHREVARLQRELERLQSEEYRLRMEIDRTA